MSRILPLPMWTRVLSVAVMLSCFGSVSLHAQITPNFATDTEPEDEGIELLQTDPYDFIRFTDESGGGWVKVEKLPFRSFPNNPRGSLTMQVRGLPGVFYEAKWKDIQSIEFWEQRLQRELNERRARNDFSGAFPFLAILYRDNPGSEEVEELRRQFLFENAIYDYKNGDLKRTLAMLEELRRIAPGFRRDDVLTALGNVTDKMMTQMLDNGELETAQRMLARLEEDYNADEVSSIPGWNQKFLKMAEDKRDEAIAARDAGQWRQAGTLAAESLYLYPEIPGGQELLRDINVSYPLVKVGVLQTATVLDPTRIDNWPSRRTGRLVYRTLFEMQRAGPEGGEYDFLFGDFELSYDLQELQLTMKPEEIDGPLASVTSYMLGDRLTQMSQRGSPTYKPSWAATLNRLSIPSPRELGAFMRSPHVLPHSLLQVKVDGSWAGLPEGTPTGDYYRAADNNEEGVQRFLLKEQESDPGMRPREIIELHQDDATDAVSALVRGELDILDHIFPSDVAKLDGREGIRIGQYPLPTVHMLIPVSEHPYLVDSQFKRAIAYGIAREEILKTELLGRQEIPGCRIVSGPFPAGLSKDDPLGYAYNHDILPYSYQPQLAYLHRVMTEKRFELDAQKKKEEPPKLTPLRLGYPRSDLARIACTAIQQQLALVEIPVELVELPEGVTRAESDTCDLVYTVVALWEPITDARRVLGPEGLAGSYNQQVGSGLRRLERAKRWNEVRDRLLALHAIAHTELPVIPLWQLVDSYAYRTSVGGMGRDVVSLYQNVNRWRLNR